MGTQRRINDASATGRSREAEIFTGCCSSLSAPSSVPMGLQDGLQDELRSACFDSDRNYNLVNPHLTISPDEILRCVDNNNGLCISDEQLDSFIESQSATVNSIEFLQFS